nr:trna wybutosine-synthesizing protein 2 [Quercus suber]
MERAVAEWLSSHDAPPPDLIAFTKKICKAYLIYGTMVLLPPAAFPPPSSASSSLSKLYALISHHLKTTHIAITHPIPLLHKSSGDTTSSNLLRAPSNFEPLHGSFGPPTCAQPPGPADFADAYWVTAKQNTLRQTWAPRWTMFSRGNISEKARLLALDSVLAAVEHGNVDGRGCAAVDLYVGIGYFAFSYLKAGVKVVLGWDLNAWSLEGLRRGAKGNGWDAVVVGEGDEGPGEEDGDQMRVVAFNESNEGALRRVRALRRTGSLPPVRHVNCGLLPTSRGSWEMALGVLDLELGGWVHVHENFAVAEIEAKAEEVRQTFENMMVESWRRGLAQLDAINRLKSYAPGVIHCVVDIYISPSSIDSLTSTAAVS